MTKEVPQDMQDVIEEVSTTTSGRDDLANQYKVLDTIIEDAIKDGLQFDLIGGCLTVIDSAHYRIHKGISFSYQDVIVLNAGASQNYLITIPTDGKNPHVGIEIEGTGVITIEAFTGCDRIGTTLQNVFNRNMQSTSTPTTTIHKGTTDGTTDGTRFYWVQVGSTTGSTKAGGNVGTGMERIFKKNDKVLLKITSGTASQTITFKFDFYEI